MSTSLKSFCRYGLALMLLESAFLFAAPVAESGDPSGTPDNEQYQLVNEVPRGTIDGWNTTFTVSRVPQRISTDHLYRNGVPLIDPADYQVRSNVITLAPSEIPQVGDTLYFSYVATAAVSRSVASMPIAASPISYRDEISIAATREALRSAASNISTPQNEASADRRLHIFNSSKRQRKGELEALTMLSARLAEPVPGVANGIEGLGDAPTPSVYLTAASPQAGERNLWGNGPQPSTSSATYGQSSIQSRAVPSSSAIDILENRLSATDPQQLRDLELNAGSTQPVSPQHVIQQPRTPPSREMQRLSHTSREAINILASRLGIEGQVATER